MSPQRCVSFLIASWIIGVIHSVIQLAFVVDLPFCGPNELDSLFCDLPRFINLACIETYTLEFVVTANSGFISVASFLILTISYIFIWVTVKKNLWAVYVRPSPLSQLMSLWWFCSLGC
jgi:olfactory receptor